MKKVDFLRIRNLALIFLFAVLGFAVMGYHPGIEDDNLYLPAVKADLNPALLHHGAEFFTTQLKTTTFDTWMTAFIRVTHIPLAWSELLWQFLSVFFILLACWSILARLFEEETARWGGIALFAAMLTLPVAGTGLYLADQYLHPRNPATALILWAIARIVAGKRWQAAPLLALGFVLHPLMGAFGISFCCILVLTQLAPLVQRKLAPSRPLIEELSTPVAAAIPFLWIFRSPSPIWLQAMHTRHLYFLYQWEWYEWLGAIGPIVLFWFAARFAQRRGNRELALFSWAVFAYAVFQQLVAMVILSPLAPVGFTTLEPMRYLHLVYVFLCLIGGAYLGMYLLKTRVWRWAAFLLVANGAMFAAQRDLFAATPHIELPNLRTGNPWLQAFSWIRQNTPTDAYFAVDPNYMNDPGEDFHSFRGLAERGVLADAYKDTATVTKEPELGPEWKLQVDAQKGWSHFQLADFEHLKSQFDVDWVLVSYPPPSGLICRWHNATLTVCQIP